ncbi:Pyroglutamyl-peptidase 1 [Erysiphe necator]|uniref:Pyroglutamyl-peptidase I n=1 Tax=Uncinula necator TaxID=52586 RepID=A0A0B1P180_UNCNE|nr:Pyroglutamyl-peptidase 1 [Erysiphe necator]KHJ31050.1 putative pyroglutamyl peptidase type [Erysiphe necator]
MSSTLESVSDQEISVLITGFAPFYENSSVNSSWEIARKLPSHLYAQTNTSNDGGKDLSRDATEKTHSVQIFVYPEPIKVAYKTVRELVPKLWDSRKIDFMIHIGMAANRNYYSIERRAHRDGYLMLDVDCMACPDLTERTAQGKNWIWYGLPEEILSEIHVYDTCNRWRALTSGIDVRISEDAGRYLCDFIYYSSLAELTKRGQPKKVIFLHVPEETDDASISTGINVTIQLIKAIVQSEFKFHKASSDAE